MKICPFVSTIEKSKDCDFSCMFYDSQNLIDRCRIKYFMEKTTNEIYELRQDVEELKRKR